MAVTCGVPQGSVLGPLLFLIYMNDLPDCLSYINTILFADDTSLYKSSKNIRDLYSTVNQDMNTLSDWFRVNKLSLNARKCNFMFFTNSRSDKDITSILKIGNDSIEKRTCIKFLGIHLDEKLTWNYHIKICRSKIAGSIYAINRIKHLISQKYLRTLYFSMIYPYLSYGIILWGSAYNVHKTKLITMQKRAIRIIAGAKYNDHTQPLFYRHHVLKMNDVYQNEVAKIIFRFKQNSLPVPLKNIFTLNSDIHDRQTRQMRNLQNKRCRTTLASQLITCTGPKIWNSLPLEIRENTHSLKTFSKTLASHVLESYKENAA